MNKPFRTNWSRYLDFDVNAAVAVIPAAAVAAVSPVAAAQLPLGAAAATADELGHPTV